LTTCHSNVEIEPIKLTLELPHVAVDKDLLAKIDNEIKHEEEQGEETPDYITSYLKSSPFQITDKPGSDEITLTRKFGNEE